MAEEFDTCYVEKERTVSRFQIEAEGKWKIWSLRIDSKISGSYGEHHLVSVYETQAHSDSHKNIAWKNRLRLVTSAKIKKKNALKEIRVRLSVS